ncbi:putative JmjC domain-containing protein 4 [Daphnia magna]|uniref:Jumonji domain-containing protein 4 n=1 Tax=Daphnia magna TaxID=35525 RepID=A0A164UJE2_9CRUS|nr:putative JmjC domain-containing protein 4 [Daphnia magna]
MEVDVINNEVCYSEFYNKYLIMNRPCLLSKTHTESWLSRKLWAENELPSWENLLDSYGEAEVPVANCGESYFDSHPKSNWTLKDFVTYMREYKEKGYPSTMPCLYLKDWHLFKHFPGSTSMYETPIYFAIDWLNEYWIQGNQDDYRFVYIGPKGSWTPLHADVYGSFSWSANVVGKKRWIFLPPGEEVILKSLLGITSLPRDLEQIDISAIGVTYYDIVQSAGEVVFVPSGWHHQVWNLEDTISINHNWFNGANASHIHKGLLNASIEIEEEVSGYGTNLDEEQLEVFLNSHYGMNFRQFRQLLQMVVARRNSGFLKIHSLKNCLLCSGDGWCNQQRHQNMDRQVALELLKSLSKK